MELLYNGIELPDEWPPKSNEGIPYLDNPPEVINIDIGRQLFVDNFLIETSALIPKYHTAVKYEGNPVFYPQTKWEKDEASAVACPKSGGVWWDEQDKIFKMWYEAGWLHQMAYAVSKDGINWERPDLDIEPGTNKILTYGSHIETNKTVLYGDEYYFRPDSTTVFIDKECKDKSQRYKLFLRNPGGLYPAIAGTSSDGIHWDNIKFTTPVYDRSTMFYNPFRKKWVYSIRANWSGRSRCYRECDDYLAGAVWTPEQEVRWLACDNLDRENPYIRFAPQLYNVDAVAYESIVLGMFQIMYGPENNICELYGVPKITELMPMYSRDGFHWSRPSRETFINASLVAGSWDRGYVQSVGGICVVMEDELWFYYTGFGGDESNKNIPWYSNGMYSNGSTGIAKLRRDGFVSLLGSGGASLLTRPLCFHNKTEMFVNFKGKLSVQLMSCEGDLLEQSLSVCGDSTKMKVEWNSNFKVSSLNDKPFRIKFILTDGEIYSFWFSSNISGDSGGYLAAGSPFESVK